MLCELEGVRQPEAAQRLGWKAGTLTGRLTRARQLLVQRLTQRGLAPTLAGGGLGLSQVTAAAAAPPILIDTALSLARAGGTIPPAILQLAKGATPMISIRTKLAAAILFAGGMGAVLYPMAQAQPPGLTGGGPPPVAPPAGSAPTAPSAGMMAAPWVPYSKWEYKFVSGLATGRDAEKSFAALGLEGWEYCGPNPSDGGKLVFKRPLKPPVAPSASPPRASGGSGFGPPAVGVGGGAPALFGGGSGGFGSGGGSGSADAARPLTVLPVKHALATELESILGKVFRNGLTVTAEPRSNSLILRGDEPTLAEAKALIEKLDVAPKP